MKHPLKFALAMSVAVLVSACSEADMNHFVSGGSGNWSTGTSSGSAPSVRTYQPTRCYQTSRTQQTCFN